MQRPQFFKSWIDNWAVGKRIFIWLILIADLIQFVSFAMTQNYIISLTGFEQSDISFGMYLTYVGILAMLPIQFRLFRYFETRGYLLFAMTGCILFSIAHWYNTDVILFFIIRFFQGVFICCVGGCMLTFIFSSIKKEKALIVGSSVFYGSILASASLIGIVAAYVVNATDWKVLYLYILVIQIACIPLVLMVMRPSGGIKSYPLYQIDWPGALFFTLGAVSLAYTMVYGSKYYWLEDRKIRISVCLMILGLGLYLVRLITVKKRPMLHLSVFKKKNFIVGLILLALYYGLKDSINLIYAYVGANLHWNIRQVISLALINLTGIVSFMILATQLMTIKKYSVQFFLILGFGTMLCYHLLMYYLLTPDLSYTDLMLPMFLQGASSGLLFVPIMVFVLTSQPPTAGTTGIIVAAYTRYTTTLFSIAGFYNLQLYYNKIFNEGYLMNMPQTTPEMEEVKELGFGTFNHHLAVASQLLTSRSIFMLFSEIIMVVLVLVIFVPSIYQTYLHYNKKTVLSKNVV